MKLKKMVRILRDFLRKVRPVVRDGILRRGYKEAPQIIIIEPTNICNLKCTCCPQGHSGGGRTKGFMSRTAFTRILSNIDLPVKEICLYLHGEPMLNSDLDFFVSRIEPLRGVIATIFSNGYNINMVLLEKILAYKKVRFSFSMDLSGKQWYEHIRQPAKYETAIASLQKIDELFAQHKRKYDINIIDDNENDQQATSNRLLAQFKQLKSVSYVSKFPWPNHFYTGDLSRIEKHRKSCLYLHGVMSVFWDGTASICSFDYDGKMLIGNMLEEKYSEIYNSPQARRMRRYFLLRRWKKLPLCQRCLIPRFQNQTTNFNRHTK